MYSGLKISGFRSLNGGCELPGLSRINVLIGENNAGKSNVLRFLHHLGQMRTEGAYDQFDGNFDYELEGKREIKYTIHTAMSGERSGPIAREISGKIGEALMRKFPAELWLTYDPSKNQQADASSVNELQATMMKIWSDHDSNEVISRWMNKSGGHHQNRCAELSQWMHARLRTIPSVHTIGVFRRITAETGAGERYNGGGLIPQLRRLQNPEFSEIKASEQKHKIIHEFLRDVLGDSNAQVKIPAEKDEIYISLNGRILPLDALGTGIHQLIIMAFSVTLVEHSLICIEEPEANLHPAMQRKFIDYIAKKTSNSYFISTHSNVYIDYDRNLTSIYRCSIKEGKTGIAPAIDNKTKAELLHELGYKASDLLQSNCIIWVEGPSDREYINYWLSIAGSGYLEGFHYSVMYYGGKVLSHFHVSGEDDQLEAGEFIDMLRINRNAYIVMDSDRESEIDGINATKTRIKAACDEAGMHCWITEGREMENYVPFDKFSEAVESVHGESPANPPDRFSKVTALPSGKSLRKVEVAKNISGMASDGTFLKVLDLGVRITDLLNFIGRSSHVVRGA